MKVRHIIIILFLVNPLLILSQEYTNNLKGQGAYLYRSYEKNPLHLFVAGAGYEKVLPGSWSLNFEISYCIRIDDRINPPQKYTDVIHIAFSPRHYFKDPGKGFYSGAGIALGIPSTPATAGDFFATGGYQLSDGNLVFDMNLQIGYGALRETSIYGDYYETWWGFFIRPAIGLGYAF